MERRNLECFPRQCKGLLQNLGLQTAEPVELPEPAEPIFSPPKKKQRRSDFLEHLTTKNCEKILFTNTEKIFRIKLTTFRR